MAITEELLRVVTILNEEGFGALAGELLSEISLGREVELAPTRESEDGDRIIVRVPIADGEQLAEAISIIRSRLVEPIRAFAQAEQIVGELSDAQVVRIRFIDPEEPSEIEPLSRRDVDDATIADRLDDLLERLPQMIEPPTSTEA